MFVCRAYQISASFSSLWAAVTLCKLTHCHYNESVGPYIERKNMQVKLIPFLNNIDFIDVGNFEVGEFRERREIGLIAIRA